MTELFTGRIHPVVERHDNAPDVDDPWEIERQRGRVIKQTSANAERWHRAARERPPTPPPEVRASQHGADAEGASSPV